MSHANLNRRAILAGAATLPALALPAVVGSAAEADPIIEIAERCIRAHEAHSAACSAFEPADQAMIDWRAANPPPAPSASAVAVARWKRSEKAAERRTGYTRLSAVEDAAGNAACRLVEQLRDAKPRSFSGLAAKARAARLVVHDELNCSIVWDIAEIQKSGGVAA